MIAEAKKRRSARKDDVRVEDSERKLINQRTRKEHGPRLRFK